MNELSLDEKNRFDSLVNSISEWFAFEVSLILTDKNTDTKITISGLNANVIAPNGTQLESSFLDERNYETASTKLTEQIKSNYSTFLRGKILFEILLRIAQDRRDILASKRVETFWNNCITKGFENLDNSHIGKILTIFQQKTT